ncbi:MAG TPA: crossover junction endodeoxyribonuclease RuvC [Methanoregulaceae archaeon]|nr:crossover junction endodeoxyribonuclease RuvC [Methanoregulaceae archaeon]
MPEEPVIVVGIDPGLARVGYGVLRKTGNTTGYVTHGCITTDGTHTPHEFRLQHIYNEITDLLKTHGPRYAAIEKLFFTKNITSAMGVSEVRGVIFLACAGMALPVYEYTPNQVKQAVTGSGRADKKQVQEMIKRLLHLDEIPRPDDAADGLSVALCHINQMR